MVNGERRMKGEAQNVPEMVTSIGVIIYVTNLVDYFIKRHSKRCIVEYIYHEIF